MWVLHACTTGNIYKSEVFVTGIFQNLTCDLNIHNVWLEYSLHVFPLNPLYSVMGWIFRYKGCKQNVSKCYWI